MGTRPVTRSKRSRPTRSTSRSCHAAARRSNDTIDGPSGRPRPSMGVTASPRLETARARGGTTPEEVTSRMEEVTSRMAEHVASHTTSGSSSAHPGRGVISGYSR